MSFACTGSELDAFVASTVATPPAPLTRLKNILTLDKQPSLHERCPAENSRSHPNCRQTLHKPK